MEANYFTILWWFLPFTHESAIGVHISLILKPPPISLPIPSLRVVPATGFECPVSCLFQALGLVIYFTYGDIHVLMLLSQIIPPSPSPTESVCSLQLCLFCCLTYRVIVTTFLNSIYMHQYTVLVFFFLAYFTLYNRLQFHPTHRTDSNVFFLMAV